MANLITVLVNLPPRVAIKRGDVVLIELALRGVWVVAIAKTAPKGRLKTATVYCPVSPNCPTGSFVAEKYIGPRVYRCSGVPRSVAETVLAGQEYDSPITAREALRPYRVTQEDN